MSRKPPVKHSVKQHVRRGKVVNSFTRGSGSRVSTHLVRKPRSRVRFKQHVQMVPTIQDVNLSPGWSILVSPHPGKSLDYMGVLQSGAGFVRFIQNEQHRNNNELFLDWVESYRSPGGGRESIEAFKDVAKQLGVERIVLDSRRASTGFWKKMGFVPTGEPWKIDDRGQTQNDLLPMMIEVYR